MLNKILEREIKNGLKAPLYYLWGKDPLLLEDALSRSIETVISKNPVDFNLNIFHPSASSQQILDAALTLPFMADRRLVILKDFQDFPEVTIKDLLSYLKRPSSGTCMIILSNRPPKKGLDIKWKVYHLDLKERDMLQWVRTLSLKNGIKLTDTAINILLEFTGYDTGLLSMEIEKLANSGKKTIKEEDVVSSITLMRHFSSFELISCIIKGQKTRAMRMLRSILREGSVTDSATLLLGALNWHFREFYNLWLNRGKRPPKMSSDTYNNLKKFLPFCSEERFLNIFKALHEADVMIKTGGMAEIVLETLLINLLSTMADGRFVAEAL